MSCPGSVAAEEPYLDYSSPEAKEGQMAHLLGELAMREMLLGEKVDYKVAPFTAEMFDAVLEYRDFVKGILADYPGEDYVAYIEEFVSLEDMAPWHFGTLDLALFFPESGHLEVVDLKYGRLSVLAYKNPQLRLYSAGTLMRIKREYREWWPRVKTVRMSVAQPRIHNFGSWQESVSDNLAWYRGPAKEAVHRAMDPFSEREPGPHCRYCLAGGDCKPYAIWATDVPSGDTMTAEERSKFLDKAPAVVKWAESFQAASTRLALAGEKVPAYKLVRGITRRFFPDQAAIIDLLKKEGVSEDKLVSKKLVGLGDLEKLVGKKHEVFKLAVKPLGALTLVPDGDPREEVRLTPDMDAFDD